ncbi:pyridoxal-phosphate dependent enzyme [Mariprofundus sp. EBB-1]|uniref:pyridoxal-phosphate dependent enzyme n=1 Tax=Mariprofundus sp. EBB-1 TaxID=2650971 RepID=UPI000EF1E196|nr:pyridoxal-phosphate dependent enzyme [Mariprofundus sp. EBB-1]RLL53568.1 pyridoxal-phosphate dependent enzyme [Mariprofundus sp. EBB-1]
MLADSAIEPFLFRGHRFLVKRDDLIDPLLSGNKYRKLYSLIHTPAQQYKQLLSYGGTQSNAMLSIAALCHQKSWQFHYTSKPVPAHLKQEPTGNLKLALELGMQLHEVAHDDYDAAISVLKSQAEDGCLFVPQGGADPIARAGIGQLATEITQWQQEHEIESLYVVTPSGTGTTAFYLAEALNNATVLTTPAVGDKAYLLSQMNLLGAVPENLRMLESDKKHHFARPYPELLKIWQELKDTGIAFDLIYGALMWHTLLQHIDSIKGTVLYVHSGGLIGNATMLERYRHKGMILNG